MPLPFNPMQFVTPYTAIGQGHIGAGAAMANAASQMRQNKVSEGYLANTQHQTAESDKRYGQHEFDQARAQLDAAMESGNSDAAEAALNNLRIVGQRYGISVTETRSDAQLTSGVKTDVGDQEAAPPGESAAEATAPEAEPDYSRSAQEQFFRNKVKAQRGARQPAAMSPPTGSAGARLAAQQDMRSNDNIDRALATGGELPSLDETVQRIGQRRGFTDPEGRAATFDANDADVAAQVQREKSNPGFYDTVEASRLRRASTGQQLAPAMRPPGGVLPRPASAAEPAGTSEAPLRGYTINGPDGKPLYSVAPKDVAMRQRQRVSDVFGSLSDKTTDPEEQALIAQGQAAAEKLVGVVPIDKAVAEGLQLYTQAMQRRNALAIVDANHKPRFGGSGMPSGLMGKNDDKAESIDKYGDNIEMALQHRGIPAAEESLAQAEGALMSGDPALQKDALKIILKARSGLTVSEAERRSYSMVDGALPAIGNAIAQWTGEPLSPQTVQSYLAIVRNMRQANATVSRQIVAYEQHKYEAQNRRKVNEKTLRERSQALDPNAKTDADLDQ